MIFGCNNVWRAVYDNSLTAWNPELWAMESVAILEESMVLGQLVHRDFDPVVSSYGQTVHTRSPAEFKAKGWAKGDTVTVQDASATDIQVKLDQIRDVTFTLSDVERTYAFQDLVSIYLQPAVSAIGRSVDRSIAGQAVQFLNNRVGGLGQSSSSTIRGYLVDTVRKLNDLKVNEDGRQLVFGSGIHADILKADLFVAANTAGTSDALRRAEVGNLFGMGNYMSLSMPYVTGAVTGTATATAAAASAGATAVTLASSPGTTAGQYVTIAGDNTPLRVSTNTTTPSLNRPLLNAVGSSAAVTLYTVGAVDMSGGYAAGWAKEIHVDNGGSGSPVPKVGQLVAFSTTYTSAEYVITEVTSTGGTDYDIMLDRPLEASLTDDLVANYGPNGSMNLAFNRNAITLVNRPLELPQASNVRAAVAQGKNVSVRVMMSYDLSTKSTKISVDVLFGIKVLNSNNGCVLLG